MKKSKIVKIFHIMILIFFIIECLTNVVVASNVNDIFNGNISDVDSTNIVGKVLGVVQAAGYATATIVLTLKGIQYIWSSPDGKAELKKQFIPYFIGIVILIGGGTLAKIIADVAYNS